MKHQNINYFALTAIITAFEARSKRLQMDADRASYLRNYNKRDTLQAISDAYRDCADVLRTWLDDTISSVDLIHKFIEGKKQ